MMEKTLILKHISGMLCLLISYSKFTRTPKCVDLTFGDFLTIMIFKQGDYLVVEKVKT